MQDLAVRINPIVRGWINYVRFYRTALYLTLKRINRYLLRWARRKFKGLRTSKHRAWAWLVRISRRDQTVRRAAHGTAMTILPKCLPRSR
jgi:RNA-directed DNA polymerase